MLKKIEIDKVDYGVMPCPFCGRIEFLRVTDRFTFEELFGAYNRACITIRCDRCDAKMNVFSLRENDYHAGVTSLLNKWNTRT